MATVTFTTWSDLLTKLLNDLAGAVEAGAFTTVSYSAGNGFTLTYRSMEELRAGIDWVRGEAAAEVTPAVGRTYAKNGGGGRW